MSEHPLRALGLKVTAPRMRILKLLENSATRHLSAEDIYRQLTEVGEEIGLATVYRVLTQFEAAGLITRNNFASGHSVFELTNEGEHHDHLVCSKCGMVAEFVDELIEERQRLIAKQAGFEMTDHALIIYGICRSCCSQAP